MELGLRLGDSSPPFKYSEKPQQPSLSHKGLDFSLGFSSYIPHVEEEEEDEENQNINDDEEDDDDDDDSPFQLDLLPRTPVGRSHNFSLPSSETAMAATDGRGESPGNAVVSSGFEVEYCKYGGGGSKGRLFQSWEEGGERDCCRGSDEDDQNMIGSSANSRKKLRLSREQSAFLEESFKEHHTLYPKQKLELARRLNLRPRQVEVWFQNRRARTKLKQTEVDCEYLKKCCETLTQENRKLQKELKDLRALKTTDSLYMHLPATTLTMCPSCERVVTATVAATATAAMVQSRKEPMLKASGFSFTRTSSNS